MAQKEKYIFLLFLLLAFNLGISSCKSTKKTVETTPIKLDYKSSKNLLSLLHKNEFDYTWFSAKFSSSIEIEGKNSSLNANIKAKKDSILWLSLSPALGIEVARAIITTDSVKFIDRVNNKYFIGDYNYLSQLLRADLDFDMLQALLTGNSAAFYEEDEKLKSAIDEKHYLLSTVRKKKLERMLKKNEIKKELIQRIWLNPETFKITKILINDFVENRSFEAMYSNYRSLDSLLFPFDIKFAIRAEKDINIEINYSKVSVNKPQNFPFSIPASYEAIR